MEDGNFFVEIEGLPVVSYDDGDRTAAFVKKPSRVKFDTKPMRVRKW